MLRFARYPEVVITMRLLLVTLWPLSVRGPGVIVRCGAKKCQTPLIFASDRSNVMGRDGVKGQLSAMEDGLSTQKASNSGHKFQVSTFADLTSFKFQVNDGI